LPQISSLGAFIHALLLRAYLALARLPCHHHHHRREWRTACIQA